MSGTVDPEIVSNLFHILLSCWDDNTDSRMVGAALKFVGDPSIPWQRVLGSSGAISDRGDGGEGARLQADRLREGTDQFQMPLPHWIDAFGFEEGVDVSEARGSGVGTGGRWRVNLNTYGWCE